MTDAGVSNEKTGRHRRRITSVCVAVSLLVLSIVSYRWVEARPKITIQPNPLLLTIPHERTEFPSFQLTATNQSGSTITLRSGGNEAFSWWPLEGDEVGDGCRKKIKVAVVDWYAAKEVKKIPLSFTFGRNGTVYTTKPTIRLASDPLETAWLAEDRFYDWVADTVPPDVLDRLDAPANEVVSCDGCVDLSSDTMTLTFDADTETLSGRVDVRNSGEGGLEILHVQQSCSCTSVSVEQETVSPGETTGISVTMDTTGKPPEGFIVVYTNDPSKSKFVVTIKPPPDYTPLPGKPKE